VKPVMLRLGLLKPSLKPEVIGVIYAEENDWYARASLGKSSRGDGARGYQDIWCQGDQVCRLRRDQVRLCADDSSF